MDLEKLTDEELKVLKDEIENEFEKRNTDFLMTGLENDEFDYTHR